MGPGRTHRGRTGRRSAPQISILRGTTEALVDGVTSPDDATLTSLHDEILRLSHLITDLESLAAADAAGRHLERRPTDLATVAAAIVDLARPAAGVASLTLSTELQPTPVHGDPRRLQQAITALVASAVAYTPPGGHITIGTCPRSDRAPIEVSDTGPGIDDADLPRLFERFYRGRRTRFTAGSGIGLAVAHDLVTAHDGTITVTNNDEGGARFTIGLPLGGGVPLSKGEDFGPEGLCTSAVTLDHDDCTNPGRSGPVPARRCPMWWHGDWGAADWIAMTASMALFWGLVIGGIIWAIRASSTSPTPRPPADPRDVVRERFARGEIDEETYRRMIRTLDEDQERRNQR